MNLRACFILIVNGRLTAGGGWSDGPTRFLYGFQYNRRIYQWNIPDRLPPLYA